MAVMQKFGLKKQLLDLVPCQIKIKMNNNVNQVIFIMGVSGCGKSTIVRLLSDKLNIPFF
ncbi:ATP-binding cassette domain-containing protein [Siansivirga zeaxanthinifaciens]|uniref:ATP-binding cassette domain-containing protein n=1 Tax=Siansivirga zeaxanthinifaciens TaxID=762954 RepID=UPI0029343D21|nr:ATP-binding cassette domain-containing protein [Siansivirga zeaxanthinifaciens]